MQVFRLFSLLVLFVLIFVSNASAQEESNYPDSKALIINTCPFVELSDFSFKNQYEDRATRFHEDMKWKNIGKQSIVAFEIVILKYDAFNRRLIGTRWTVTGKNSADWKPLEPEQSGEDGTRSLGQEEVFTGVAYVRLARLKDGTVWRANDAKLLEQLRKIAPNIEDFGDVKPDPKPK